jgi:hypothetical protein
MDTPNAPDHLARFLRSAPFFMTRSFLTEIMAVELAVRVTHWASLRSRNAQAAFDRGSGQLEQAAVFSVLRRAAAAAEPAATEPAASRQPPSRKLHFPQPPETDDCTAPPRERVP